MSIWKPKAPSIDVFVSYVTNAHEFFIKNRYEFYDFFNEEARKTVRRPKLVKAKKDQNGQTSSDEHIADVVDEAKPEPSDTMMQDQDLTNQPAQQITVLQEEIADVADQPETQVDAMSED